MCRETHIRSVVQSQLNWLRRSKACLPSLHARVRHNPVCFPGLSAVIRECLFKVTRVLGNAGPYTSNKDCSSIECLLVEEFAAPVLELADRGDTQRTGFTVSEIQAPLVGLWIIQPQIKTFDVTRRAVGFEFHQISAAIPNLANNGSASISGPNMRTG